MSLRFSQDVLDVLRSAGWYEGRRVNVQEEIAVLAAFGFTAGTSIVSFLEEFHGLHFDLANGPHDFDVRKAISWMAQEDVPYMSMLIDEPLCPIGYGGRCWMLLSPSNKAIQLHDEWLGFVEPAELPEAMWIFLCCPSGGRWVNLEEHQKPTGYWDTNP